MKAHLPEYLAELLGTAVMMFIGIGAVAIMWAAESPMPAILPSEDLRRLITGVIFAGGATLVVLSPLGQRSGGHLNPAVTLAFWRQGQVRTPDAAAYMVSQILGAIVGVYLVSVVGSVWAGSVQLGITLPGAGYTPTEAFVAETVITFLLMYLILFCVSNERFAKKTPYLAGSLVAFLVFVEAPISGTSLNPARSFAPAILTMNFEHHWLYWIAPPLGALLALGLFSVISDRRHGCAKLFHTERYRCIFADCVYQRVAQGEAVIRQGEKAEAAFIIERGEFEVRTVDDTGRERVLGTLGPGEWIGEMGLLLELPRSATVVALTEGQLRHVTPQNFAHVIAEHPTETARLLKQIAGRLYSSNKIVVPGEPPAADPAE